MDLEVSLEEPFKNKWAVSTVFHSLDKAGSPAGKTRGAQKAKPLQSRPGGAVSREDRLGLLVSPSLGFLAGSRKLAVQRWGDDGGTVCWSLRKLFNEELSALWQGRLKPSLICCLAHRTVFKQWVKGDSGVFSLYWKSWDLSEQSEHLDASWRLKGTIKLDQESLSCCEEPRPTAVLSDPTPVPIKSDGRGALARGVGKLHAECPPPSKMVLRTFSLASLWRT